LQLRLQFNKKSIKTYNFDIDITNWPDAIVNTIMHAENLFSSATVVSKVSL